MCLLAPENQLWHNTGIKHNQQSPQWNGHKQVDLQPSHGSHGAKLSHQCYIWEETKAWHYHLANGTFKQHHEDGTTTPSPILYGKEIWQPGYNMAAYHSGHDNWDFMDTAQLRNLPQ